MENIFFIWNSQHLWVEVRTRYQDTEGTREHSGTPSNTEALTGSALPSSASGTTGRKTGGMYVCVCVFCIRVWNTPKLILKTGASRSCGGRERKRHRSWWVELKGRNWGKKRKCVIVGGHCLRTGWCLVEECVCVCVRFCGSDTRLANLKWKAQTPNHEHLIACLSVRVCVCVCVVSGGGTACPSSALAYRNDNIGSF